MKPIVGEYLVKKDAIGPYSPMPHLGNIKWNRNPLQHGLERITVEFDVLGVKADGLVASRAQCSTDAEYIAMLAIACMTENQKKQLVARIVAERIA